MPGLIALLVSLVLPAKAALPPGAYPCTAPITSSGFGAFLLLKQVDHTQTSAAAIPAASEALARIDLTPPPPYSIADAIVAGPGSFKTGLVKQADGTSSWSQTGSETAIAALIPPGVGTVSFQLAFTNGDSFVGFLPFTVDASTPPVPQIVNYDEAQLIDPQSAFTFQWNGWVGSTTNDRIHLTLMDSAGVVITSAATDCTGDRALLPGATGFTLAPDKLSPDSTYTGYLTFGASLYSTRDESTRIDVRAFASRTTKFTFKTATTTSGNGHPATLLNSHVVGTNLVFTVKGTPGDVQRIDSTSDFVAWVRETQVTLPASGSIDVSIAFTPSLPPRFYRAVAIGGSVPTGAPPSLGITLVGTREFDVKVTGTAGVTYQIQLNLDGLNWTPANLVTIPANGAPVVVRISLTPGQDYALVRAVIPKGN